MEMNPRTKEAYQLMHDGTLALARAERLGMRVDVEYCERKQNHLTRSMARLESKFMESDLGQEWKKLYGHSTNINSDTQLGRILYQVKGLTPPKSTASGKGSTDEESLSQLPVDELKFLLQMRKMRKLRDTYLDGFYKEQVDGVLHPSFNLHTVQTFRSCVAEGSKVLVVRDFETDPEGIPIEQVRAGDSVYCFDDDLNPAIRKVLWAGKTGRRKVVRIHWTSNGGHGQGHLDVTPEHLVRLIDGRYEKAENLCPKTNDHRAPGTSKHLPKVRVLSCCRVGDSLRFTGHLRHGNGILEHHLIYNHFVRPLEEDEIVHHKNERHLDHSPHNLFATNLSDHSKYHAMNRTEEQVARSIQILHENRHKIQHKSGQENANYLGLTKTACLRELAKKSGKASQVDYDFNTFKKYLDLYGIDQWVVSRRYDRSGRYISRGRLQKLGRPIKIGQVVRQFGINYKKAETMLQERGIEFQPVGACRNPYGRRGVPGNHIVTKIEWLENPVDVYDIEVEDFHNFFANEICVHNSSDRPNFQNIPKRDKEAMEICRRALFPRKGNQLLEVDYSGIEVRIAATYHKDPTMLKYILDPTTDMHGDMAKQIFLLDEMDKKIPAHKTLRNAAKNGFVFPQFYGDYYINCAENLACRWGGLPKKKWKPGQGMEMPQGNLSDWMISHGIKSFDQFTEHIKKIEDHFWNVRFQVYQKWKEKWLKLYHKNGYFDMHTGFRCQGIMGRNDAINYPVQGAAFHCLLWSFIQIDKLAQERGWNTRPIGQIHDAIVLDMDPAEKDEVFPALRKVMCEDLVKEWTWINVPLDIEADIGEVDASWADIKPVDI